MGKITQALKRVQVERQDNGINQNNFLNQMTQEGKMKNSWLVWFFVVGVIVTVFVAFNYQNKSKEIPLSEIFPDEATFPVDVEYEYDEQTSKPIEKVAQDIQQAPATATSEISKTAKAAITESKIQGIEKQAGTATTTASSSLSAVTDTVDLQKVPYTIQVASFKEKVRAEKIAEELRKKDFSAFVVSKDLGDKGTWYRIYVGQFTNKETADNTLTKLKPEYQNSFVITPASKQK